MKKNLIIIAIAVIIILSPSLVKFELFSLILPDDEVYERVRININTNNSIQDINNLEIISASPNIINIEDLPTKNVSPGETTLLWSIEADAEDFNSLQQPVVFQFNLK